MTTKPQLRILDGVADRVHPGRKLKRLRESQYPPLSQRQFAESLHSTKSRVGSYEAERALPPSDLVKKAAETYAVPIEWFFDGEDTPPPYLKSRPSPRIYGAENEPAWVQELTGIDFWEIFLPGRPHRDGTTHRRLLEPTRGFVIVPRLVAPEIDRFAIIVKDRYRLGPIFREGQIMVFRPEPVLTANKVVVTKYPPDGLFYLEQLPARIVEGEAEKPEPVALLIALLDDFGLGHGRIRWDERGFSIDYLGPDASIESYMERNEMPRME